MYLFNYLFINFYNNEKYGRKSFALFLIGVIQLALVATVLKIIFLDFYEHLVKESMIKVFVMGLALPIGLFNYIYYSDKRIIQLRDKFSSELTQSRIKLYLVLLIVVLLVLFLPSTVDRIKYYW